jgi:hypothetical protein
MNKWTAIVLVSQAMAAASTYVLKDNFTKGNFFDNFYFMNATDPSKGYVEYVNQTMARELNLYNHHKGENWMFVDNTTIAALPGRKSVRIQSNNIYNQGLFIFDVNHIP